jgi:hypothetical protein
MGLLLLSLRLLLCGYILRRCEGNGLAAKLEREFPSPPPEGLAGGFFVAGQVGRDGFNG